MTVNIMLETRKHEFPYLIPRSDHTALELRSDPGSCQYSPYSDRAMNIVEA